MEEKNKNKGRLYTELFKYSMHINYFGDTIFFTGFAFLTASLYAFIIPIFMTLGFIFKYIPSLDKYLDNRYKEEFVT